MQTKLVKDKLVVAKIYCITSPSGKQYVGCTTQSLKTRIYNHMHRPHSKLLKRAIKKYGKDGMLVTLIEKCEVDLIFKREKHWIEKLNTKTPNGYNLTDGGEGHLNPTKEARAKISAANARRVYTKEDRKKMSERAKAYRASLPKRTHCNYGHELSEDNLYIEHNKKGKVIKHCRLCRKLAYKKIEKQRIQKDRIKYIANNAVLTECSRGHKLTAENTFIRVSKLGHKIRQCRECKRVAGIKGGGAKREKHNV